MAENKTIAQKIEEHAKSRAKDWVDQGYWKGVAVGTILDPKLVFPRDADFDSIGEEFS